MILAEKIADLRKQNGWSQEELAEKLEVTRQSVSKWESAASIPDIEKIIRMSELFAVSTDYLLKEENAAEEPHPAAGGATAPEARRISLEFAAEYMDTVGGIARRFGCAVALCVFSPFFVVLLSGLSEAGKFDARFASGIGVGILLLLVAAAVSVFIVDGMKLSKYAFLEKEPIRLEYGAEAAIRRRKEGHDGIFGVSIAIGVILCILSALPVTVASMAGASTVTAACCVSVIFPIVAVAVFLFVSAGMVRDSFLRLLQMDNFSPERKRFEKKHAPVLGLYWCAVTAGYLAWSFITGNWERTWIVWPIAGVLSACLACALRWADERTR